MKFIKRIISYLRSYFKINNKNTHVTTTATYEIKSTYNNIRVKHINYNKKFKKAPTIDLTFRMC